MKINNKGYASTIIMFSVLTIFLISMLMLVKTMNNSSSLNNKITEKVVDNIDYDSSGSVQDRLSILENQLKNMGNSMLDKIYPVGSVYISTTYSTTEEVKNAIGGTWEKYAQGRTIIGEGAGTDSNGLVQTFTNSTIGGEYTHKLINDEMPNHTHSIPSLTVSSWTGSHSHSIRTEFGSPPSGTLMPGNSGSYMQIAGDGAASKVWVSTPMSITSITVSGQKTTSSNTGNSGSSSSFNIQNPYIVTYIYKRIK